MRLVRDAEDFEAILSRFLDWRATRPAEESAEDEQLLTPAAGF
jgi:hypothetical protein